MSFEGVNGLRHRHLELLRETQEGMTPEVLAKVRDFINNGHHAGRFVSDPKDRDYLRSLLLRWGEFIIQYSENTEYMDLSLLPFEGEVAAGKEQEIARQARKRTWQQSVSEIALAGLYLLVFAIMLMIIQSQISAIGALAWKKWLVKSVATPPTVAIPGIGRIEVYMNGNQLNLDHMPSLHKGEEVILEVNMFDTSGKEYTCDDLVCKWSVAPLDSCDEGINTDLCKTLYIPSQEYAIQRILFEVEGLEQQFEPSDPVSMEFDIIE